METQPAWSILAAIGAAAASGGGARAALDDAVQRLAAQCDAAVDVWAATGRAGELRHLAGGAGALAAVTTPAEQPALAHSLATLKTVVGPAGSSGPDFLVVPLPAYGRAQGVLLAQATKPRDESPPGLPAHQPLLEEVAPLLGHLVYTAGLEATLRAGGSLDSLGTLCNRRHLRDNVERELARARRTRSSCAVLLVSLDRVAALDVEQGPPASDRALQGLAALLHATCRGYDAVGHYSSDRFLAVLPDTDGRGAQVVADRLLTQLYRSPAALPHDPAHHPRVSIGIACFPVDGFTADELLDSAVTALIEAQRLGGNRIAAA